MKGITLPLTSIVIIAIAVLALVVVVGFFLTTGGGAAASIQQEKVFRETCIEICQMPDRADVNLAARYPNWQSACEALYAVPKGAYIQCLDRCGCVTTPSPCEYLCMFKSVMDDWSTFCGNVVKHPSTIATYGRCKCEEC